MPLVLARFTDATGLYSSAGISAVNRYTGANKVKGGTVDRAIERLKTIRARTKGQGAAERSSGAHGKARHYDDLGPILVSRFDWHAQTGEILPDGPGERTKVLHVLPVFGEATEDRIWFGASLVTGVGGFNQPLKVVKDAGDVAARLLLLLYASNDMETWGGVRPVGERSGPWIHYKPVAEDESLLGGARLIRAKRAGTVGQGHMFHRAWSRKVSGDWWKAHSSAGEPVFVALRALQSAGLVYEMVVVLNRKAVAQEFDSGAGYNGIPEDAEPLYELDCCTKHGYKPDGEEGIGGATANTAGNLGYPVATLDGRFDGTYAAIVRDGFGAMVCGIFRLRFRVANLKNTGVKDAWARIRRNNREAFDVVQLVRRINNLPALESTEKPRVVATSDAVTL